MTWLTLPLLSEHDVAQGSFARILDAIACQPPGPITGRFLAAAAAELHTPGVSVTLAANSQLLETICATTDAYDGDRLQADLGEGPSLDAFEYGWPVLCEALHRETRWPAFCEAATSRGIHAIFAFPLQRGAVRLGALTLSRHTTGELEPQLHSDALIFARLALDLVLARTFTAVTDLDTERVFRPEADSSLIHQATGIISVQRKIGVAEALAMLRANAYTSNVSLGSLADDIVNHRIRLD